MGCLWWVTRPWAAPRRLPRLLWILLSIPLARSTPFRRVPPCRAPSLSMNACQSHHVAVHRIRALRRPFLLMMMRPWAALMALRALQPQFLQHPLDTARFQMKTESTLQARRLLTYLLLTIQRFFLMVTRPRAAPICPLTILHLGLPILPLQTFKTAFCTEFLSMAHGCV